MSITVLLAALALILWPGPAVGDDVSNSAEIETAVSLRVRMLAKARRAQTVPLTLLQVQNNLAGLAYIEFQDVDGQMGPRVGGFGDKPSCEQGADQWASGRWSAPNRYMGASLRSHWRLTALTASHSQTTHGVPQTISAIRRFREDHCLPPIAAEPDMGVVLDPLTDQYLRMMVTAVQLAVNGRNPQVHACLGLQ